MPATIRVSWYGGQTSPEPSGANAESGIKFSRDDNQNTGGTPVPIPTSTGTNYSYYKLLAFEVTATAATAISNRRVYLNSSLTTGLYLFFQDQATYTQPTNGNRPADVTSSNGATPSGYTALTATTLGGAHLWDNTSTSCSSTGRKGNFCQIVAGVGNNYAGGASSATALSDLKFAYDEA